MDEFDDPDLIRKVVKRLKTKAFLQEPTLGRKVSVLLDQSESPRDVCSFPEATLEAEGGKVRKAQPEDLTSFQGRAGTLGIIMEAQGFSKPETSHEKIGPCVCLFLIPVSDASNMVC